MTTKFKILEQFASGGMADIFLASQSSDTGFSKIVAIKKIKPMYTEHEDLIKMFEEEAKIGQQIQNNNVVQVMDFIDIDDSHGLVMEFVKGFPLSAVMQKKAPMDADVTAYIAAEIAKGLSYVHDLKHPGTGANLGIIHRDISPGNILVSVAGEVKLTDFGIAKSDNQETETQVGIIKGKFTYMSPEQFRGDKLTAKSDIYSLGVVIWEALMGEKMHQAPNEATLLQKISEGPSLRPISSIKPEIPPEISDIVSKCIQPEADQRYENASSLYSDLSKFISSRDFNSVKFQSYLNTCFEDEIMSIERRVKKVYADMEEAPSVSLSTGKAGVVILNPKKQFDMPKSEGIKLAVGATYSKGKDLAAPKLDTDGNKKVSLGLASGWHDKRTSTHHVAKVATKMEFKINRKLNVLTAGFIIAAAVSYVLQYELGIDILKIFNL